jgi:hypothetical protein
VGEQHEAQEKLLLYCTHFRVKSYWGNFFSSQRRGQADWKKKFEIEVKSCRSWLLRSNFRNEISKFLFHLELKVFWNLVYLLRLVDKSWTNFHLFHADWIRVARWYIFKPKIPILVYFWRPWNGIFRCILLTFGILRPFAAFNGLLVYFLVCLVYIFPFWFYVPRKIWQPWAGWISASLAKRKTLNWSQSAPRRMSQKNLD